MINGRSVIHCHSYFSNLRMLDALSSPEELVDRAISLGINMLGLSDHESLSGHIRLNKYAQKIKEQYPNFKIAYGNEIYLTKTRDKGQKYFHFLLTAKDGIGHHLLREQSSRAWINGFYDRGLQRVPTLYSDLEELIQKYGKNHLIASSACIGSAIGQNLLLMRECEKNQNDRGRKQAHNNIVKHILWCKKWFGDDFYLEIAPAEYEDQIYVNNMTMKLGKIFDTKVTVQDDAHRLSQDDYIAHKALLNSKITPREDIDSFYKYTYLQSYEDIKKHLSKVECNVDDLFQNSMEMYDKVEEYSLLHSQQVPQVPVKNFPKKKNESKYQYLNQLYNSDNDQERYWVNYCVDKLKEKNIYNDAYLSELNEEARVQLVVGKHLNTCIFSYPIFLAHYFDMIWECGSVTGCGRGCFLPDTNKVMMENGKVKAINDIVVGDSVRTLDGSGHKVINTFEYNCNENISKITLNSSSHQPITCTKDHKFYAIKSKPCYMKDRKTCSKHCKRGCKYQSEFKKEWIEAQNLEPGDFILFPKQSFPQQKIFRFDLSNYINNKKHFVVTDNYIIGEYGKGYKVRRFIDINEDFMYFIGVMIGDGWVKHDKYPNAIGIAFNNENQKDKDSMHKCEQYLDYLGLHYKEIKHKQKALIQLTFYCGPLANLLIELINQGVENKQIPDCLLFDDFNLMFSLFKGLMASDGSYDKTALRISYDSINFNLINQVRLLWNYLDIYGSIVTKPANGRNKQSYKLKAGGVQLNKYIPLLPLLYQHEQKTSQNNIVDKDGIWLKVREVSTEFYSGKVYDIKVEGQHNYIINDCCVHNSSSAGLDNYLFNLTQYDPIKNNVNNYFRYLNDFRYELPDLDFDLAPSVRPKWFSKIREERGYLGLAQVCTFSTMSAKAAILAACRGYRTDDYPNGIENDEAQYLASLVGSNRGFTYSISDMTDGNKEKSLKPNIIFIKAVNQYPGLLDIIKKLEGTISARSQHASGIIFSNKGHEFDDGCFMTAPNGNLITQWSLSDAESAGKVKIDSLVTDIEEKITQCLLLLQKYHKVEQGMNLRQLYSKYIHPDVLPLDDKEIWDNIDAGNIHNLFQFDTAVGSQGIKKLQPRNLDQLSAINALIRLMAQEPGAESPLDRYARIKAHPEQWNAEMTQYGLTKEEQDIIKEYCGDTYGTLPLQDDLMLMMLDKRLFDGFDLKAANNARSIIGKKKLDKIPKLHEDILKHAKNLNIGTYIYDVLFSEQLGYAFNREHTKSYSMIGFQCAYLAVKFPRIYWDCACLRVDSGIEIDDTTNYAKTAKAIGKMSNQGIEFSLLDINRSDYNFEPDEKNNTILYGMKSLNGTNGEAIQEIINNRPYISFDDFLEKVNPNRTIVINLIKGGAFNEFDTPQNIMKYYLRKISNPKKRLTMQNFNSLVEAKMIPKELKLEKQVYNFNKMIKKACKYDKDYFALDKNEIYYKFYSQYFDTDLIETRDNHILISKKNLKKQYDKYIEKAKAYIQEHQEELLTKFNDKLFKELWDKYAKGTISTWEMDALGMYYHEHELSDINEGLYGIKHFKDMPTEPPVNYVFKKGDKKFPVYKTTRICGTVIAKDDVRSSISLLTKESGVVTCKMNRDYYAIYNRQISEIDAKGEKHIMEKGWFSRGTLLVVNGYRRNDTFKTKSVRKKGQVVSHQLYKIIQLNLDGSMIMTNSRYGEEENNT